MVATKNRLPGRPRSFDKDQALETAIRLFHQKGYDGVGVAELVAELGIRPPSFYAAFGSKAGLLEQAMVRYSAGGANVVERAREAGGCVADVIERALHLAARTYPACDGAAGCMVLDGARNSVDPAARSLEARAKQTSFANLRDFIATENPDRAARLARMVIIALSGMSAAARDGATGDELGDFASVIAAAIHREMPPA